MRLAAVDKFFQSLTVAIERTQFAADARFTSTKLRAANYKALTAELQSVFRQPPRAHWLARLNEHDVPHSPFSILDEACADLQVQRNEAFQKLFHSTQGDVISYKSASAGTVRHRSRCRCRTAVRA